MGADLTTSRNRQSLRLSSDELSSLPCPLPFDKLKNFIEPSVLHNVQMNNLNYELLQSALTEKNSADRSQVPLHITTSCIVVSSDAQNVLLLFHKKYREWVYPGGHADGDWLWLRSALRECEEETGLRRVNVVVPEYAMRILNDADKAKFYPHYVDRFEVRAFEDMPAHQHIDVVFVFLAEQEQIKIEPKESDFFEWVSFKTLEEQLKSGIERVNHRSALTAKLCLRAQGALGLTR